MKRTLTAIIAVFVAVTILFAACDTSGNDGKKNTEENTLVFEERTYIKTEVEYPDELTSSVSKNMWIADTISAAAEKEILFVKNGNVYSFEKSPLYTGGKKIFDVVNENTKETENLYSFILDDSDGFIKEVFVEEGSALSYPAFDDFYSILAKMDAAVEWKTVNENCIYVERIKNRPRVHGAVPLLKKRSEDAALANASVDLSNMPDCEVDVNIFEEKILSVFLKSSGHEFLYGWGSYLYDTENDTVINKGEFLAAHGVNLAGLKEKAEEKKAALAYEDDGSVKSVKTSFDDDVYDFFINDISSAELHYAIVVEYSNYESELNPAYLKQTYRISLNNNSEWPNADDVVDEVNTADPKEFVGLYIKALCEGDAEALNLLYGKELFSETQADPVLETDKYSEIDGITRVIETEDGFIVSQAVKDSDVYFVREGNCIGYTCYVRKTGDRFVMVATAKYAFEFAECSAEDYSLFPYTEDFRIVPDEKTLNGSFSEELLTDLITSALKKGDFFTLDTLCKDMSVCETRPAEGEPAVINRAPFGYVGPVADVVCKKESETTVKFEVKTLDGKTVKLTATLKKDGDGYCLSTLAVE